MNKSKLYILLTLTILHCVSLQAQQKAQISLDSHTISRQGDKLNIAFTIQAKDIQLHSDQSLRLELSLEDDDKYLVLPCVIYTGNKRYKYDRRGELLSGQPQFEKGTVYKTIRGIDKNTAYVVDYTLSILYESWMDHASIHAVQLFHDCCNESPLITQVLLADLNLQNEIPQTAVTPPAPRAVVVWNPDPAVYRKMASMLTAPSEAVKERSSAIEVQIDYPQGIYKVLPSFGKNTQQLAKVHTFMGSVMDNELITLNHMLITGYASPEGTYQSNEILARNRSVGFKQYMIGRYKLNDFPIDTESVAEDWEGLIRLLNDKNTDYTADVLAVIYSYSIFEGREKKLMELQGGIPYRDMLKNLFPLLRRIELEASYSVSPISDEKARELVYTRPNLLSLEEIYRVAENYTPGTPDYKKVYEIAAKTYPNDAIANNNAAAACLISGDAKGALPYLNKLGNNRIGHINRGVYYYMLGDMQQAQQYLHMALESEDTRQKAEESLLLLKAP